VKYSLQNGVVKDEAVPVEPNELFRLGKIDACVGGEETTLTISKRPTEIRFCFTLDQEPNFGLFFKGAKLNSQQQNSLIDYGYFVRDDTRIHFVTEGVKEHIELAFGNLSLPALIRFLRVLYQSGLIDEEPSDLVNKLREKNGKRANYERLFIRELYPYQEQGVDWLSFCAENGVGTILADDMGLGKTAQVIALCCDLLVKNSESKILIVVPNPLLDNWIREFSFFAPSIAPYLHYGVNRRGVSSVLSKYNVVITPYTTMASDIAMLEELSFDLALFDEASLLKNPKSGRSIAARRLNVDVSVAMSGTPVENSLLDAWALSDLVFPGFLGSLDSFKARYVKTDLLETVESDLSELEKSLRQITLRRMKKDVLKQLPEKLDIHTAVSLGEKEQKSYDSIIAELQQDSAGGGGGILPLISKLQQFTAHPALIDPSIKHDVKTLCQRSAKFELLLLKLDAIADASEKVIIFATFRKAIDLVHSAILEKYGIAAGVIDGRTPNSERQRIIDEFSSSEGFDVLILHPRTAGMGLNITAATHVIHYCRQWNPALEAQATARAWRNGQKSIVTVHYLYYANTIEEKIDERLRLKQELSHQVVSVASFKETDKQILLSYLEMIDL
jgi:SNF2 family DNA or RNA helicase